jgi:hypothetical protein
MIKNSCILTVVILRPNLTNRHCPMGNLLASLSKDDLEALGKFVALWAALPTAAVALITAIIQGFVARKQARAAAASAQAANRAASAAEGAAKAALENARLKQVELDRSAVTFLSNQRREDIGQLRSVLIQFYALIYSHLNWSAEEIRELQRLQGEIYFRLFPNDTPQTALAEVVMNLFMATKEGDLGRARELHDKFVCCVQEKFYQDFRCIELQIQKGRID